MGWKKDRLEKGWKQQMVWLRPESVTKLEGLKKDSGKSYQDIINEIILGFDRPLEDEETRVERKVLEKLEAHLQSRLGAEPSREREPVAEDEEGAHIEIPDDLQDADKRRILNTIRDLHENEGRSFRSIVDYLKQKGINAVKKGS